MTIKNENGWLLDFAKFRRYLKDRFLVEKAFLFIGYINDKNKLYAKLREIGYFVVFKPTLKLTSGEYKGNCDAELVLHAMDQYNNYDGAVIVSGDGDFYCLVKYLLERKKLKRLIIPNGKKYSSLFREFLPQISFIDDRLENKLKRK